MMMPVNLRERDGVTIFDIQGRIIGSDSLKLKSIIDDHIASKAEGEPKILLNLAKMSIIDSSALCVLVAAYTSVQQKKDGLRC